MMSLLCIICHSVALINDIRLTHQMYTDSYFVNYYYETLIMEFHGKRYWLIAGGGGAPVIGGIPRQGSSRINLCMVKTAGIAMLLDYCMSFAGPARAWRFCWLPVDSPRVGSVGRGFGVLFNILFNVFFAIDREKCCHFVFSCVLLDAGFNVSTEIILICWHVKS